MITLFNHRLTCVLTLLDRPGGVCLFLLFHSNLHRFEDKIYLYDKCYPCPKTKGSGRWVIHVQLPLFHVRMEIMLPSFFAARASITVGARPGANNACTGAVASMRGKPINIYAEIKVK
jgi:hypothetical protein